MPRFTAPGRIALGLALLGGGPAVANDGPLSRLLHHKCDKPGCGEVDRVTIPGRQVEIVTERPRVTVSEAAPAREVVTRHVRSHRVVESAPVSVGTVYLPVALPAVTAVPLAAAPGCREVREVRDGVGEGNPFADLHQAEVAAHQAEVARLKVQATVEAQQRFLARMNASAGVRSGGPVAPDPSAAEITRKIEELAGQVGKLNTRVETVEKILVFHDNLLKDRVLGMPTPVKEKPQEVVPPAIKVESMPATKAADPKNPPMIPPLPPGQ